MFSYIFIQCNSFTTMLLLHLAMVHHSTLYSFYRASICEGGLGSRNSVCPSVCHTRGL